MIIPMITQIIEDENVAFECCFWMFGNRMNWLKLPSKPPGHFSSISHRMRHLGYHNRPTLRFFKNQIEASLSRKINNLLWKPRFSLFPCRLERTWPFLRVKGRRLVGGYMRWIAAFKEKVGLGCALGILRSIRFLGCNGGCARHFCSYFVHLVWGWRYGNYNNIFKALVHKKFHFFLGSPASLKTKQLRPGVVCVFSEMSLPRATLINIWARSENKKVHFFQIWAKTGDFSYFTNT
jgi:hypothetical protein